MSDTDAISMRLIELRKTLGIKQYQLAEKLGVTNTAVCAWEGNRRNIPESMLLSICREYHVNYFWLTAGEGEMFTGMPQTLLDEIAVEYGLDETDKKIVEKYLNLKPEQRKVIKDYFISIFT